MAEGSATYISAPFVAPVPAARPRVDKVAISSVVVMGALALAVLFITGGDIAATLGILAGAAVLVVIWFVPLRWTVTVMLVLGATLEAPYEAFAEFEWRTPWSILGTILLGNLNLVTHVAALKIDGFGVLMIYLFIIVAVRRARGVEMDVRGTMPLAPPMVAGVIISIGSILALWVWGIATGGLIPESLLQIQKMLYSALFLLLMHVAYRGSRDLRTLGIALVGSAVYRAVLAVYIHKTVFIEGVPLACSTTHADTRLFAAALVFLVVMFNERVRGYAHWTRFAAIAIIGAGMVCNGRRLVWVAVAGGVIIAATLSPLTVLKRRVLRMAILSLPLAVLYVAVGWNHTDSSAFRPVKLVRSVVDSNSDGSSLWRDLENTNMVLEIKSHPFTGQGFGHQYVETIKLPDVSAVFPRYRFLPHNGLLVLFPFCGPLGVTGVLAMLLTTVFLASRTYRASRDPAIRAASLMSIVLVYLHLNQCYGDIGAADWLSTMTLAPAMLMAGKLSIETGAWPWRSSASPAAPPSHWSRA